MTRDFEEWFACLDSRGVRYLVVGAHAVAIHGRPRFTEDLDVLVDAQLENAERLLEALEDFGFGSLGLRRDDFLQPGVVVQLGYPPVRIDILTSIAGVDFAAAWDRRLEAPFGSRQIAYLGREDLIRSKRAAGRPQDLLDLEYLRRDDG